MDIPKLKQTAADALGAADYSPTRLTFLHTAAALGASLLLTVVSYLLTRQMDTTGGLSGIGTRTTLETARMLLTLGLSAALPFWDLGYLRAALGMARREKVGPATLPEGFRRFFPALRLMLLRTLLYTLLVFLAMQAASILYMFSPFSLGLLEASESLLSATDMGSIEAVMETAMPHLIPLYILVGAVTLATIIPAFYRLRLADYAIMDEAPGALAAIRSSNRTMRGNCLRYFRLDLSFWWYYALQLVCIAVSYGDKLLPLAGIAVNGDVAMFVFYGVSLGLQLLITCRFAPLIQTTYAAAYHHLCAPCKPEPEH